MPPPVSASVAGRPGGRVVGVERDADVLGELDVAARSSSLPRTPSSNTLCSSTPVGMSLRTKKRTQNAFIGAGTASIRYALPDAPVSPHATSPAATSCRFFYGRVDREVAAPVAWRGVDIVDRARRQRGRLESGTERRVGRAGGGAAAAGARQPPLPPPVPPRPPAPALAPPVPALLPPRPAWAPPPVPPVALPPVPALLPPLRRSRRRPRRLRSRCCRPRRRRCYPRPSCRRWSFRPHRSCRRSRSFPPFPWCRRCRSSLQCRPTCPRFRACPSSSRPRRRAQTPPPGRARARAVRG